MKVRLLKKISIISSLLPLLAATPVWSAERPVVKTEFTLAESGYRSEYKATEIKEIESRVARRIASVLNSKIGFLAFSSEAPSDFVLTFKLDSRGPGASPTLKEVGFFASLTISEDSSSRRSSREVYWVFRTASSSWSYGSVDTLVREIDLKLLNNNESSSQVNELIREVLSHIPIARTEIHHLKDPLGWIIPYKHDDLCMGRESSLLIDSRLPSGGGPMPVRFEAVARMKFNPRAASNLEDSRGNILCMVKSGQEEIDRLERTPGDEVVVSGVYVIEYMRACRPRLASPEDLLREGGGL